MGHNTTAIARFCGCVISICPLIADDGLDGAMCEKRLCADLCIDLELWWCIRLKTRTENNDWIVCRWL